MVELEHTRELMKSMGLTTVAKLLDARLKDASHDHSLQEIADETGIGYKTITSIYYRMIQKLRDELGGEKK